MARILLIEDNETFRSMVQRMLLAAGYDVEEASDGKAGLACYRQQASDLVITDILMPGTEGVETIRELLRHDPAVKIIAMSGGGRGPNNYYLEMALKFGACRFLSKPFTQQDLEATVAEVLATNSELGPAPSEGRPT
jgi:CheY-like chemotaxis protein